MSKDAPADKTQAAKAQAAKTQAANPQPDGPQWRPSASHSVALKDGSRMDIHIFESGTDDVLVTQTLSRSWGGHPLTKYCLWCDGKSIGCVECTDQEWVDADCVKGQITCVPNRPGGGAGERPGLDGLFGGVDAWPWRSRT